MVSTVSLEIVYETSMNMKNWLGGLPKECKLNLQMYDRREQEVHLVPVDDYEKRLRCFLRTWGIQPEDVVCFLSKPPPRPVVTIVTRKLIENEQPVKTVCRGFFPSVSRLCRNVARFLYRQVAALS